MMHFNGDVDALDAASETPGDFTNCDFFGLRKNTYMVPSASMRAMTGLI